MKFASVLLALLFALSTNANANNPVVDAECAAIFKGMSITLQRNSPDLSARANNVSARLMAQSGSVIGRSTASQYYRFKMDEMTADLRTNGGTGVRENEMKFCVGLAKSYGMM